MKGYLVAKGMLEEVLDVKLYKHIEFFTRMKTKMHEDA